MLGTGNAEALDCYNSSHLVENDGKYFLVDTGGGNGILRQLRRAGIRWQDVRDIFVTHRHVDHSLGVVWFIRHILAGVKDGSYQGAATIYVHPEMAQIIRDLVPMFFSEKHQKRMKQHIHLHELKDGETVDIVGRPVTFFDVHAPKVLQFGYSMELPGGGRLVSCGDEPAGADVEKYTRGAEFLMHEAFCLEREPALMKRKANRHSSVEEAASRAQLLGAKNLILHHTQDNCLAERKATYTEAARHHFDGTIYVPDDLDRIPLGQ